MFRKTFLFSSLFFLITSIYAFHVKNPWFWIFLGLMLFSFLLAMEKRWLFRSIIWFVVFFAVKVFTFNGFFAFFAATIVTNLFFHTRKAHHMSRRIRHFS